jgi:lipoate-protein ligase A
MEKHRDLFAKLLQADVRVQGHTDLTLGERKFSGNAQRRKRQWLLFHGTFLLSFDLPLLDQILLLPSRQPDYRANRRHTEFVCNTGLAAARVKDALRRLWEAHEQLQAQPEDAIQRLVAEKYSRAEWNLRS